MSFSRVFTIEKSSDEEFDFTVEVVIKDPAATALDFSSATISAIDDSDSSDATSDVINLTRTSVSGNKITFGVKGGVSGSSYLIKAQGDNGDSQKPSAWGTLIVNDPTA